MLNESEGKLVNGILSSKAKFRRAVVLSLIIGTAAVTLYGFYTGQLLKIVVAVFK